MSGLDYTKSARTDKTVSAAGNVFALNLKISEKEEPGLIRRINSSIPHDIVILSCLKVDQDFNAWTDTKMRQYYYYFLLDDLDIDLMNKACKYLIGEHDFINFCRFKDEYKKSGTVRIIFNCFIEKL